MKTNSTPRLTILGLSILLLGYGSTAEAITWTHATDSQLQQGMPIKADHVKEIRDKMTWDRNGANAFFNTGRVGIGNNSPAANLHVSGSTPGTWTWTGLGSQASLELGGRSTNQVGSIRLNAYDANHFVFLRPSNGNYHIDSSRGRYYFNWDESIRGGNHGHIHMADEAGNEDLRLSTSGSSWINGGNVGIGTSGPSQRLEVVGNIEVSGSSRVLRDEHGDWSIGSNTENIEFREPEDGNKLWATIQDDWGLRLTGAPNLYVQGNAGIGTASPGAKLDVIGTTQTDYLRVNQQNGSGEGGEIRLDGSGSNTTWYLDNVPGRVRFHANGSERFTVRDNGRVGIGTASPGAPLHVVGNIIANNPTASNHVATKSYVDSQVSGGGDNLGNHVGTQDLVFNNYGIGVVGTYSSYRYQNVFSMGTAYTPDNNGTSLSNMYGIAYTHSNVGGQSIPGLSHQALFVSAGVTRSAIGNGVWTQYNVTGNRFVDRNNTGYYVDPASTNRMNLVNANTLQLANGFQLQQGGSNYGRFNSWVHLNGHYGLYASINGAHLYPNNATYGAWRIQGTRNGYGGINHNDRTVLMMQDDLIGLYNEHHGRWIMYGYGSNGNTYISPQAAGNVGIGHTSPSAKLDVSGSTRSTEFYARNWFRNDNAGEGLYNQATGAYMYSQDTNYWRMRSDRGLLVDSRNGTRRGYLYHDGGSNFGLLSQNGSWKVRVNNGGGELYNVFYANDLRPHIVYDRDNTGYYWNGASTTSNNDTVTRTLRFHGVGGSSGAAAQAYGIYQETGGWSHPYPDLMIRYHTGIKMSAHSTYGGIRFYTRGGEGLSVTMNDHLTAEGIVRSNQGFQVDGLTVIDDGGGWHRSYGNSGWYNGSYGGGWYMQDSTWIRTYGNKSIYHNTGTMRTDGTFEVGPSGNRFRVLTNGRVGINRSSPGEALDINGSAKADAFLYNSDARLKTDVETSPGVDLIKQLRGVTFTWTKSEEPSMGLIAQEVESVLPLAVRTSDTDGLKTVDYAKLVAPLIEAVKEQQDQIDAQQAEIDALKAAIGQ